MPETIDNARRWSGYVCPDCRFVFRVPRDHDGKGIVCPSCRRMMRIPEADDVPPPLLSPIHQDMPVEGSGDFALSATSGETPAPSRRRRAKKDPEVPRWETDGSRIRHGERKILRWTLILGIPVFILIVAAVVVTLRKSGPPSLTGLPLNDLEIEEAIEQEPIVLPDVMKRNELSLLEELEPMTRKFLNATHVDEILPLIYEPERIAPLLMREYPDGKIDPVGLSTFNASGSLSYRGKLVSLSVRTADHELRQIGFVDTPKGLKIDWESWFGWSEMTWQDFMAQKPITPQIFRVILKQVDYYNFAFDDEDKWQAYSLQSPDGNHVLYGYAEKGSVLNERLRPNDPKSGNAMMVALKFPDEPAGSNQVLIESFVTEGWVDRVPE